MSHERDLVAVFGRKAEEFSDYQKRVLRRLWNAGRREGVRGERDQLSRFFSELQLTEGSSEMPKPPSGCGPELVEQMTGFWRASIREARAQVSKFLTSIPYAEGGRPEPPQGYDPELTDLMTTLWRLSYKAALRQVEGIFNSVQLEEGTVPARMPKVSQEFEPALVERMSEMWRASFEEGVRRGDGRLGTLFTRVISKEPIHEVFDQTAMTNNNGSFCVGLKPWVQKAFQEILDAPDLDAAQEAADEAKAKHRRSREQTMSDTYPRWNC